MKFSSTAAIATLAAVANADLTSAEVSAVNGLFLDIESNEAEYLGFMETAVDFSFPTALIGLVEEMITYTDDSYTTLFETIPADEYAEITQLAVTLPWYSSRLESLFEATAAASSAAATTEAASSAAATTEAASSAAATTEAASSAAASSAAATTVAVVSSAAASSTAAAVSTFTGGAAAAGMAGLSVGASILAVLLL
ncbi:hypothetical protein FOA43_002292 [Brettanomyces nanus]|uniref:Uncharacterized protein n=1 Tax=Eeniella nana TaxID=13502 RepID=A0A875S204_EENNA|nr:uncharacterized protein FOA43_002292 [Brettanomyces nanus]QPG74953.1 hypothetical protein FOA43_002292 [Brettanomyces nanus]